MVDLTVIKDPLMEKLDRLCQEKNISPLQEHINKLENLPFDERFLIAKYRHEHSGSEVQKSQATHRRIVELYNSCKKRMEELNQISQQHMLAQLDTM